MNSDAEAQGYVERILRQYREAKEPGLLQGGLIVRLQEALLEKQSKYGNDALSDVEQRCVELCRYASNIFGMESRLQISRPCVEVTAAFARERGMSLFADILDDALAGICRAERVAGNPVPKGLGQGQDWASTDWALTGMAINGTDIMPAILDYVAEHSAEIVLGAPAAVRARDATDTEIADLARSAPASELLERLLQHQEPKILALPTYDPARSVGVRPAEVSVHHIAFGPADGVKLAELRARFGSAASDLLDVYAVHDGAELFGELGRSVPALYLNPVDRWQTELECVLDWAADVAEDEGTEVPEFLPTAIPFAQIDGDSECWLLITQGKFAGAVMRSHDDVFEEVTRYPSISHFMAALIVNGAAVIRSGGYISYDGLGTRAAWFPASYIFKNTILAS